MELFFHRQGPAHAGKALDRWGEALASANIFPVDWQKNGQMIFYGSSLIYKYVMIFITNCPSAR